MLQKTQAVRVLQEGCTRLGLPNSTAAALLQFLSVKRTHDQFVPEKDRQLRMLPGAALDKLWHYMLLNTSVSACVHDLLGGVVEHRGTDAWDLADDIKLLQRLYALNILRLEGHEPDLELWTEPDTALHTVCLTTVPVPALHSLPGGGRLHVTPNLTQQQQDQLVRALRVLYTHDTQLLQPSMRVIQPQPRPAAAESAASATPGGELEPAAKRQRVEQRQMQQPGHDASRLTLTIRPFLDTSPELRYSIKPDVQLGSLFEHYLQSKKIDRVFVYFQGPRGGLLSDHDTPKELSLKDGDVIKCFTEGFEY